MNLSAFYVTLTGTIASVFVIFINAYLIVRTRKRKHEIVLFYYRFYVDIVFGLSYFIFSFFIIGFIAYNNSFFLENSSLFWLGLPFSNTSAARTFVVLIIVLDRWLAAYVPLKYRVLRPRVSNAALFSLPICFAGVEDFVIFIICGKNKSPVPATCVSFPCTLNTCGYNWWTSYKTVLFCIIIVLTVKLCIKLFAFSKSVQCSVIARKVNRLALLDAFLILTFDFIPSFIANQFPDSPLIAYTSTGPVTAMLKQVGRVVESVIVVEILVRRHRKIKKDNTGNSTNPPFHTIVVHPHR